jgi:hypothetical protein
MRLEPAPSCSLSGCNGSVLETPGMLDVIDASPARKIVASSATA